MNFIKKLKINVRPAPADKVEIHATERILFLCSDCHNKYYQFHFFCPQCLGDVKPNQAERRKLSITTVAKNKIGELEQLLIRLSGNSSFAYQKALASLPWAMIGDGDPTVIAQWREVLEAEGATVAVEPFDPKKKKKFLEAGPLFEKDTPLPYFLPTTTTQGVKTVAKNINNSVIRLKWVEAVLTAHHIVEGFYKRDPGQRILFSDFLFKIEADLDECVKRHGLYFQTHEEEFPEHIAKLMASVQGMAAEMEAVRRQVEEQL
jgi:hypothetical protein